MTPPKKVHNTGVDGLTWDTSHGQYRWRNRITGKRPLMGTDLAAAQEKARELNRIVDLQIELRDAQTHRLPTVGDIIDLFLQNELDRQPWKDKTRQNNRACYVRYQREFGDKLLSRCDRVFIGNWLSDLNTSADTYNGHRHLLSILWAYAISQKYCEINEPAMTLKWSVSKVIKANQRKRHQLELDQFWQIHSLAPDWLQIAMELSLLTLQARKEIVKIMYTDIRPDDKGIDRLFVIREKTAHQTDMAFIALPVTDSIRAVLSRSRVLACPYVVHTKPKRMTRRIASSKPHPLAVSADHVSKTFRATRDKLEAFRNLKPEQRPGFHTIRGLGSRQMKAAGYSDKDIQLFTGHGSVKTTKIYTENRGLLKDSDFNKAHGGLSLAAMKK